MPQDTTQLYCDNGGAIIAATPGFNGRTNHTDIKLTCSREYVTAKEFLVHYISTEKQLADILAKSLRKAAVSIFLELVL
ncbi:unnamed protein product, partial [Discosporangium mesarthrocarpum]